ncbi:hypothetical protein KA531_00880 [Candidatus Saccharibacteria bacterium]|nr:hypothetical protein [Candidatus Saccharibacteria bacterium]
MCIWRIPTLTSRPPTNPTAVSEELRQLVLTVRAQLKRCAEVVWHHLVTVLSVSVVSDVSYGGLGLLEDELTVSVEIILEGHTPPDLENLYKQTLFTI